MIACIDYVILENCSRCTFPPRLKDLLKGSISCRFAFFHFLFTVPAIILAIFPQFSLRSHLLRLLLQCLPPPASSCLLFPPMVHLSHQYPAVPCTCFIHLLAGMWRKNSMLGLMQICQQAYPNTVKKGRASSVLLWWQEPLTSARCLPLHRPYSHLLSPRQFPAQHHTFLKDSSNSKQRPAEQFPSLWKTSLKKIIMLQQHLELK